MSFQDDMKEFKRTIARRSFFIFSWLFNKLPYCVVRFLAYVFITIGYQLTIRQKQIAKETLGIAFGMEKTDKEIKQISKKCFTNMGKGMIELIYFMGHPWMIKSRVVFEGKEHLDKALSDGKGVITVSAHFGNFPLMLLRCAQEGYKINAIIRSARDEALEKHFLEKRTSLGLNTVYSHPRQECVNTSIKVLRNNEMLFIPLDQNFGSGGGVFVEFFGQKAATATGPVVFAQRTQAPIIPMFIIRLSDDTHKIIVEPPIELEKRDNEKEETLVNTAKITSLIEQYIRKYPHEWGWMHRRWKSRPSDLRRKRKKK